MANFSRLTYSLGSAVNENSLALANLNFDFSLWKYEAPKEFHVLGKELSAARRYDAENGNPHRTARRLGALFEGSIARTPNLLAAYGTRVSSISQTPKLNPRGSDRDGPFSSFVGVDGTAIWAAATSGRSALAMLLLASMLARVWSPSEATSLWVEIVTSRCEEIKKSVENEDDAQLAAVQAARQEITRTELANWDASIRAWQQTADQAHRLQQMQLELILDNLDIPVSNNMHAYRSCIDNLNIALESMEDLMSGKPQSATNGAFLLALKSWHIYPDMIVHGQEIKEVRQRDPLVPPGALLTLGLQFDTEDPRGIYWSLPLAHLRYYGAPVMSTRSTYIDAGRVFPEMLMHVVLGALASLWVSRQSEMPIVIEWFASLQDYLLDIAASSPSESSDAAVFSEAADPRSPTSRALAKRLLNRCGWISECMNTAKAYMLAQDVEKRQLEKLTRLGFRKFGTFLEQITQDAHEQPAFGLCNPKRLMPLITDQDARVEILREFGTEHINNTDYYIIRYQVSYPKATREHGNRERQHQNLHDSDQKMTFQPSGHFEYATLFPVPSRSSFKRTRTGKKYHSQTHQRWLGMHWEREHTFRRQDLSVCVCDGDCELSDCLCRDSPFGCSESCPCQLFGKECLVQKLLSNLKTDESMRRFVIENRYKENCLIGGLESIVEYSKKIPESYQTRSSRADQLARDTWRSTNPVGNIYLDTMFWENSSIEPVQLQLVFGDPTTAAIYRVCRLEDSMDHHAYAWAPDSFGLGDFQNFFNHSQLRVDELHAYLHGLTTSGHSQYITSLRAMATVMDIYKLLPGTTVSLKVCCEAIYSAAWVRSAINHESGRRGAIAWNLPVKLEETLACIAMFDTGTYDIGPSKFNDVFAAIASGSSIYVSASLLCDPCEKPMPYEVKRIIGNIGRAGMSLLMPHKDPTIRSVPVDAWQMINHAAFDAKRENNFTCTSLHLRLTNSTLPLDVGNYGMQDNEVLYVEAVIQAHDRSGWVADLDVIHALRSPLFIRYHASGLCNHQQHIPKLVAIDNWEELIDCDANKRIVRASQNWSARLAVAVANVKLGHQVVALPDTICWYCIENWQLRLDHHQSRVFIA